MKCSKDSDFCTGTESLFLILCNKDQISSLQDKRGEGSTTVCLSVCLCVCVWTCLSSPCVYLFIFPACSCFRIYCYLGHRGLTSLAFSFGSHWTVSLEHVKSELECRLTQKVPESDSLILLRSSKTEQVNACLLLEVSLSIQAKTSLPQLPHNSPKMFMRITV